MENQWY